MHNIKSTFYALTTCVSLVLGLFAVSSAFAGDDRFAYGAGAEQVSGWRLGPDRNRDGYSIYRNTRHGWQRVGGSAVQIGGSRSSPWVINSRNRIFYWNGRDWDRLPGSAIAIADGWALGANREHGGYGIYRWNGRGWDQAPGGAVAIGGSYDRPWVINDRNIRFVWNGYDWDQAGRAGNRDAFFSNSFRGNSNHRDRNDDYRGNRNDQRRNPRGW
jgi:hypothetical protein